MIRKLILPAVLASVLSTGAMAATTVELTEENTAQIRQILTEQGFEVGKIKIEDGLYEAYARKDGQKFEVFMDAAFEVVRTELDD